MGSVQNNFSLFFFIFFTALPPPHRYTPATNLKVVLTIKTAECNTAVSIRFRRHSIRRFSCTVLFNEKPQRVCTCVCVCVCVRGTVPFYFFFFLSQF